MKSFNKSFTDMRSISIITLAVVIGFLFTSYAWAGGGTDTSGRASTGTGTSVSVQPGTLTITGIDSEYEGLFAAMEKWPERGRGIVAGTDFVGRTFIFESNGISGVLIENGSVTLPVWEVTVTYPEGFHDGESEIDRSEYKVSRYAGNDTIEYVEIVLFNEQEAAFHWHYQEGYLDIGTITFRNGSATIDLKALGESD